MDRSSDFGCTTESSMPAHQQGPPLVWQSASLVLVMKQIDGGQRVRIEAIRTFWSLKGKDIEMGIKDGGPAFPQVHIDDPLVDFVFEGMSVRTWLAGQALAGVSHEENCIIEARARKSKGDTPEEALRILGAFCVLKAEAVLKALKRTDL